MPNLIDPLPWSPLTGSELLDRVTTATLQAGYCMCIAVQAPSGHEGDMINLAREDARMANAYRAALDARKTS